MSVEPRTIPNWTALEGAVLPGGYEIERCLSASHSDALFKLRILGDRFTDSLVRVFAPASVQADQVHWWHDAVSLRHPNLNIPLSAGFASIDSAQLPFFAYIRPDETLDGVIAERALTPDEAREATASILSGLGYLHGAGLVHSALAPSEILAIGDSIRLSCARVRPIGTADMAGTVSALPPARYRAPESKTLNTSPAADVYCLGASLFEVLTKRQFDDAMRDQIGALPHPFGNIAEACLRGDPAARPSLDELRGMLSSPAPVRAPKIPAPPTPVAASVPAPAQALALPPAPGLAPVPAPSLSRAPVPAPSPELGAYSQRREQRLNDQEVEHGAESVWLGMPLRKWLYVAASTVALLVLLWALYPKPRHAAGPAPVASPTAAPANWPSHVVQPAASGAVVHHPAPQAAAPVPAAPNSSWRVVVYTFNRAADADKRVIAIKAQHPALDPHVFSPKGNASPYLIVLGGPTTKDEADRLRRRARASGLPRDTFIRNYSR